MQTLRKKTSPCKYKNEPSRFLGDGVSFKAKLIGILEVSEARGDRMCQEALADLKMAIRAAGEHKQRITINIAIDGLRLRDEKTGDSIYHHPVHKISFIAQDMSDSRAFGYIFGSPDTGHRFFGIKTDKAASQVVIAMRDLFQVVFELKKKEIEVAKQHIEQKNRFGASNSSTFFSDSALSSTKSYQNGDTTQTSSKLSSVAESTTTKTTTSTGVEGGASARPAPSSESAIADLVDLELELSSIQQGIHQMERITPSDPFGPNKDDPFNSDPFGDSFTSFPQKPFLPPPPSGRERQTRTSSETSSNLFSPRTPRTASSAEESATNLFRASHDDPSSCDWFTPTGGGDSLFEELAVVPDATTAATSTAAPSQVPAKDAEPLTKESNTSLLSQFDVFTELDPLGTGRSKPYVDKKLFFQELKNPPKKVLKDLVTETQPTESTLFAASFETAAPVGGGAASASHGGGAASAGPVAFHTDPFADGDPFDKADPFAEDEFAKAHDPFDTDFVAEFKIFNKTDVKAAPAKTDAVSVGGGGGSGGEQQPHQQQQPPHQQPPPEKLKLSTSLHTNDNLQPLFPSTLSKSPNRFSLFDKQMSLGSTHVSSARGASLLKQNTFDIKYDSDKKFAKLTQLHENPSLDMSSECECECAPEPPPRPPTNITPIKPPPLPPKKQPGEISVKPPPRPPHSEDAHYDYMDSYETSAAAHNTTSTSMDDTPPIPVPARKSRFDISDLGTTVSTTLPQRPKKQFQGQSSDEDYLTPVAPPLLPPHKKDPLRSATGPILLPPPMKKESSKRERYTAQNQVTVASYLESKPRFTSTIANDKLSLTPDTLDITLSQLTLSGLNELATKLNIPASQLSNMTLVQLTTFLSNYVKEKSGAAAAPLADQPSPSDATVPTFKADFSANFNDLNQASTKAEPYDRYAVFRELLEQEEFKKPTEPTVPPTVEEIIADDESNKLENEPETTPPPPTIDLTEPKIENIEFKSTFEDVDPTDRYAALREIIIEDTVCEIKESNLDVDVSKENETTFNDQLESKEQNDLNLDSLKMKDESDINDKLNRDVESNIIEYDDKLLDTTKDKLMSATPVKSPTLIKSPVPTAITEIIQTSNHLTSGSVSDVVSGSSPEIDNVGSTSEAVAKKNVENAARESWAIFDTPNHQPEPKEKQAQSEEALSPWSSDSKEYVMESPCGWHMARDSGSDGDWKRRRKKREADGTWWDSQTETAAHKEKPPCRTLYARDRRSTDSYDDDWYEPERPRRRTRPGSHAWSKSGQSSSSRDVSPWEEDEPRRWPASWRTRQSSWERHRRREDSWDEEDDYEYEDEYVNKFNWSDRHGNRDSDRTSRDSERHGGLREPPEHWDSNVEQWADERRPTRRRGHPQDDRWCRPDSWDHDMDMVCGSNKEKMRYGGSRWTSQDSKWRERERKRDADTRYYKRDHSQESPWEDDYSNDPDEPQSPRYLSTTRRNWKRPSSASEMDRKSGEIKSRQPHYMSTGGSDGERDRKYRQGRRSRSKDSQFSDMSHQRHKPDTSQTLGRYSHRPRDKIYNQKFENDFSPQESTKGKLDVKLDTSAKKSAALCRKKVKDLPSPKLENEPSSIKTAKKQHFTFENDFVNSEIDSPVAPKAKFNFENDFETSEAESPVSRYSKSPRGHIDIGEHFSNKRTLRPSKQTIGFENDFSRERVKSTRQSMLKSDLQERDSKPVPSVLHMNVKQKSLFEDDFSPTEKTNITPQSIEDNGIPVIEKESLSETRVSFTENNLDKATPSEPRRQSKNILSKSRISNSIRGDINLKKSESVNIFARENDPFDDDFFSGRDGTEMQKVENTKVSPNNAVTEFKWTEDFDNFDIPEESK